MLFDLPLSSYETCLPSWSNFNIDLLFHKGMEVKAEQLLEELDNGVLLCQLIDVLQNTVKKCCSTNNLRVSFIMIFLKIQSPKSQVVVTGKAGE